MNCVGQGSLVWNNQALRKGSTDPKVSTSVRVWQGSTGPGGDGTYHLQRKAALIPGLSERHPSLPSLLPKQDPSAEAAG